MGRSQVLLSRVTGVFSLCVLPFSISRFRPGNWPVSYELKINYLDRDVKLNQYILSVV